MRVHGVPARSGQMICGPHLRAHLIGTTEGEACGGGIGARRILSSWTSEFSAGIPRELLFKYSPQGLIPGFEGSHGFLDNIDSLG